MNDLIVMYTYLALYFNICIIINFCNATNKSIPINHYQLSSS